MRKRELDRFRRVLEAQLAEVLGQEERAVHDLVEVQGEELPDPSDRATAEEQRSKTLRLADRERRLEDKIRAALARLDAGSFGRCVSCGAAIPPERLRVRPVTDLCVACKAEAEGRERLATVPRA
jgi:DnaK suppressor protein